MSFDISFQPCRFGKESMKIKNPLMEDAVVITTSPGSIWGIPADFPRIVVCNSVDELAVLLAGGIQTWKKSRVQVTGERS